MCAYVHMYVCVCVCVNMSVCPSVCVHVCVSAIGVSVLILYHFALAQKWILLEEPRNNSSPGQRDLVQNITVISLVQVGATIHLSELKQRSYNLGRNDANQGWSD